MFQMSVVPIRRSGTRPVRRWRATEGALRGHIPSGILPRNPALKAATLLSRGFDLGARTARIFHSDDSNSHPPRPGGLVFDPFDATRIALPMTLADGNGKRQQQPQSVG